MLRKFLIAAAVVLLFAKGYCQQDSAKDRSSQIDYGSVRFSMKAIKEKDLKVNKEIDRLLLLKPGKTKPDTLGKYFLSKKSSSLFKDDLESTKFASEVSKLVANDSISNLLLKEVAANVTDIRKNTWHRTYSTAPLKIPISNDPVDDPPTPDDTYPGTLVWLALIGIALAIGFLSAWLVRNLIAKKKRVSADTDKKDPLLPVLEHINEDRNLKAKKEKDKIELVKNYIDDLKNERSDLKDEIKRLKNETTNLEGEQKKLKANLTDRVNELNQWIKTAEDRAQEISSLNETIANREKEIVTLNGFIKNKEEEGKEFEGLSKELISKYYDSTFSRLRNNDLEGKAQHQMLLANLLPLSIHATSLLRKSLGRAASSDFDNLELLKGKYVQPKGTVNEHSPQYSCDEMAYAVYQLLREQGVPRLDNVLVHGFKIGE